LGTIPHHKHLDFVAETPARRDFYSIPSLPSLSVIANERKHLIETGELSLGEPCTPHTMTKYVVTAWVMWRPRKLKSVVEIIIAHVISADAQT